MISKKLKITISLGVLAGFAYGFSISWKFVAANQYVSHGLFRLALLSLRDNVNKMTLLSTAAALSVLLVVTVIGFLVGSVRSGRAGGPADNQVSGRKKPSTLISLAAGLFPLSVLVLLLLLALNGYLYLDRSWNAPAGPNVVIVLSDTLRRDHLGCYGYERDTSPNIDLFAKDATLFRNYFAQSPSTKPSVSSIFTSKYAEQHNVIYNEDALPASHTTLAEILKDKRYNTAGFNENRVIDRNFGFAQGFELWETFEEPEEENRKHDELKTFDARIHGWLENNHDSPFFLYVHYLDPHAAYKAPDPHDKYFSGNYEGKVKTGSGKLRKKKKTFVKNPEKLEHVVALYDEEIRYVDARFGDLIKKLEQLDIKENTLILFLSDHGEAFLEHGMFYHSNSVYAEVINVPLIIRYPELFKAGVEERYAQHVDILPTILHALGIDDEKIMPFGNDILDEDDGDVKIFSSHLRKGKKWERKQRSVIAENWKLIHDLGVDDYFLFDVSDDPEDARNVAAENKEVTVRLAGYLSEWRNNLTGMKDSEKTEIDEDMEKTLRSLGYLQ